jgi:small GTP-binding protein
MSFTLAIIGRPNVGKSTLFNRLVGKKLALVDDTPGVTRDRRRADASLGQLKFQVIDTAGLEEADEDSLAGRMRSQTEKAIEEADISLFLIDARSGLLPADATFAKLLRKSGKPVILAANKAEGRRLNQVSMKRSNWVLESPLAYQQNTDWEWVIFMMIWSMPLAKMSLFQLMISSLMIWLMGIWKKNILTMMKK